MTELKDKSSLKSPLVSFLVKVVGFTIVWIMLYYLVLKPSGQPDTFLRNTESATTVSVLNMFGYNLELYDQGIESTYLYSSAQKVIGIANSCNGLILMIVFAGFVICFPGGLKNKMWFIPLGLVLIFIVNVFRIIALTLIQMHAPGWLDFNHHYVFTILVYGFIFLLWMYYINKLEKDTVSQITKSSNED